MGLRINMVMGFKMFLILLKVWNVSIYSKQCVKENWMVDRKHIGIQYDVVGKNKDYVLFLFISCNNI
jgi:hypothetical protein